jgi:hypothetical protein
MSPFSPDDRRDSMRLISSFNGKRWILYFGCCCDFCGEQLMRRVQRHLIRKGWKMTPPGKTNDYC